MNSSFIFFAVTVFFIHFSAVPLWLKSFSTLFLVLFLIAYLVESIRNKSWQLATCGLEYPFLAYLAANAISIFDAYIPMWSIGKTISLALAILLFYVMFSQLKNTKQYRFLLNVIFWGGIIVCILGLYQYLQHILLEYHGFNVPFMAFLEAEAKVLPRISSVFLLLAGTNVYACYLGLFMPLTLVLLWQKKISYVWKLLGLLIIALNIFLTLSRALYICLFITTVFFILFKSKYKKQLLAGLFIFCIFLVMFFPPAQKTIRSLFASDDSSNYEHLQTMQSAITLIAQHPINGWGADHVSRKIRKASSGWVDGHDYKMNISSKDWTPNKFKEVREKAKRAGVISVDSPHNVYLWNFIDTGIIGLMAFGYILLTIFNKLKNLNKKPSRNKLLLEALLFGYIVFLLYGLFQDSLNAPIMTSFFWVFIILVCGLEKFYTKKI